HICFLGSAAKTCSRLSISSLIFQKQDPEIREDMVDINRSQRVRFGIVSYPSKFEMIENFSGAESECSRDDFFNIFGCHGFKAFSCILHSDTALYVFDCLGA
ncbi:hypothetical protein SARC_00152, partial [Sphaeroforma arctica JP610]